MPKWLMKIQVMKTNLFPIANEGIVYILSSFVLFLTLGFLDLSFLQFFSFLATLFFIFVFRNPEREYMHFAEGSVVAPVDGIISSIEEIKDGAYAYKIEISTNYSNVSILRMPIDGNVSNIKLHRGARVSFLNQLSKDINENCEIIFCDVNKNRLKLVHRLKQSFVGIVINIIKSQKLYQGSRYGVMVNGTTTLYLPQSFRLNVSVGAELSASETLIGYFTS